MDEEKENDIIKLNIGKVFPNYQTKFFAILFFVSLIFSILSVLKIDFGIVVLGQFLSVFQPTLLWSLTLALVISTVCAYFGKFKWMFLPIIVWLLFTTAVIRTANIPQLKDVTTGNWTLAPDLDPFLYLRHAQEINQGNLQNPDIMRYAPLGSANYAYQSLMPWLIFYIYKILSILGETSLTYVAIISPVIFFLISAVGFLLFVKVLSSFKFSEEKSWICALLATLFYVFVPSMLHRTVAGIPEIESLGMIWFWFAFLFFVLAWRQDLEKDRKKMIWYGVIAGIFTGLMSWSWGGYTYIYMILGLSSLLIFLFQKDKRKNRTIYFSWVITALIIIFPQIGNIKLILTKISDTGFGVLILFFMLVDFILFDAKWKEKIKLEKINLPRPIISLIVGGIALALVLFIFDSAFLINSFGSVFERLLYPFGRARVGLTVAENAVPYFVEVLQNFGYLLWIFIMGTIIIFYEAIKKFSLKNKIILNSFFILFILGFIFSKYSPTSLLDGENFLSKLIYLGSLLVFGALMLFIYVKAHIKKDEKTIQDFKEINFEYVLMLVFAFWTIVSMRGAVRLLFVISSILPIIMSFVFIRIWDYGSKREGSKKLTAFFVIAVLVMLMVGTFASYSIATISSARATSPGVYEQQWQQAMAWVRDNTPKNSTFVHWWDYGYWVQTLGERPTVTDGGHFIGYWDHLIGRYLLTTPDPNTAFSFMKTHDVSYLLIDSSDIGKYGAYSKIGSNEEGNDRFSYIPVMVYDSANSAETNESKVRIYQGGVPVDEDIIYNNGEQDIFLPEGNAYLGAMRIEYAGGNTSIKFKQPYGIFIYNQKQVNIPLRYLYYDGQITDFSTGMGGIAYIIPGMIQDSTGTSIDSLMAVIYLSPKTMSGLVGQLYVLNDAFNRYGEGAELVYSQQDPNINFLRQQGIPIQDFFYLGGLRGPIKIWKINYPENIIEREEFLRKSGGYAEFDNLTFTV